MIASSILRSKTWVYVFDSIAVFKHCIQQVIIVWPTHNSKHDINSDVEYFIDKYQNRSVEEAMKNSWHVEWGWVIDRQIAMQAMSRPLSITVVW